MARARTQSRGLLGVLNAIYIPAGLIILVLMAGPVQAERFQHPQPDLVLDTRSGLLWMRCAVGQVHAEGRCVGEARALTWSQALEEAAAAGDGGPAWRIPEFFELRALLDRDSSDPAINQHVFPDTPADWFWTNVRFAGHSQEDCLVNFAGQGSQRCNLGGRFYLRLVRDP